jgi:AcrR family transcriptional regulator
MGVKERKQREKVARRKQIQSAAKELFFKKGFNATTMEDIAIKEELSVATLYSYFKNKEELYASLNIITLQYLYDHVKIAYNDKTLSVEEKILAFKDAFYNAFRNDPLSMLNIFRIQLDGTLATFSDEILLELNNLGTKSTRMIAAVYDEGVREGKFKPGHGMEQADILFGVFAGLVLWEEAKSKVNPEKRFLKPTLDRAFDILLSGFKKT